MLTIREIENRLNSKEALRRCARDHAVSILDEKEWDYFVNQLIATGMSETIEYIEGEKRIISHPYRKALLHVKLENYDSTLQEVINEVIACCLLGITKEGEWENLTSEERNIIAQEADKELKKEV